MKRKALSIIILVLMATTCLFGLSACGECSHERTESRVLIEATCSQTGMRGEVCLDCSTVLSTEEIKKGEHVYEWKTVVEPKCLESGLKNYECSGCKTVLKTEEIPQLGHVESDWLIDKEATCKEVGSKHKECTRCQTLLMTEEISKLEHVEGDWVELIKATCLSEGEKYKECTVCNERLESGKIEKIDHISSDWILDKEATCEATGLKHKECTVCESVLESQILGKLAHAESEWITTKEATCFNAGSRYKKCTECEALIKTEVIPQLEHVESDWLIDKEATCKEVGSKHKECTRCKTSLMTEEISKLEHTEGDWVELIKATCLSEGEKYRECSVCKEALEREKIAKLDHVSNYWILDKEATCVETGLKHKECSVCKSVLESEIIGKLAHTESEWLTDKEPTCFNAGSRYKKCTECEALIKTEAIPHLGHVESDWLIDKEATCKEVGSKHIECTRCKTSLMTEEISKLEHTEGDWVELIKATCLSEGEKYRECSVCKEALEREKIEKLDHISSDWILDKEATCVETGLKHKECTVCKSVLESEIISKLAHTESEWITTKDATCFNAGSRYKKCTECEALIKTEEIPQLEHVESDWKIGVIATCEVNGVYYTECNLCKTKLRTNVVDVLEHEYVKQTDSDYYKCKTCERTKLLTFLKETESVRVFEDVQLLWDYEDIYSLFTFTSSNPSIATVDANGKVTGVGEGSCSIIISADGITDTLELTVNPYYETKLFVINTILQIEIFEGERRNLGIKMGYHYDLSDPTAFKVIDFGSITYTIPASDNDIATVDKNGNIVALNTGKTTMQVVAKVGNKVIDEFEVAIVVTEKVQFFLSTSALQIFVSEGSDFYAPKPTEYTLTTEVKVNNVVVEDAVIEYSGYDEDLITINPATGKISSTGVKTGSTTITVSYTSPKGTTVVKYVDVSVGKPVAERYVDDSEYIVNTWNYSNHNWVANGSHVVADFSADYMFASINSVSVDGRVLDASEFTYSGYKLAISKDALKNTTVLDSTRAFTTVHNVKIEAENSDEAYVFDTNVTTIDYAIDCAAALESYVKVLQQVALTEQIGYHAILTANIDYANRTFGTRGSSSSHGFVTGILDGRGFAVANITTGGNTMFWGFAGFTLKNIAFVNVQKNNNNQGALLAWNQNGGNNFIQNVYIQGELNGSETQDRMCGLTNNAGNTTSKNLIVDVEFSDAGKMYAMDRLGSSWHGENTIAVSSTAIGFSGCLERGDANNHFFRSVTEMKNLSSSSEQEFLSATVDGKNIWTIENDIIAFENAIGFLESYLEEQVLSIETENGAVVKGLDENSNEIYILTKGEYTVTSNLLGIVLSGGGYGVDIVDNKFIVADYATNSQNYQITATAYTPYLAKPVQTQVVFIVEDNTTINIAKEQEIVKNQADKCVATVTLEDVVLDDLEINGVKFNNTYIPIENASLGWQSVTVDFSSVAVSGNGNLSILLRSSSVHYLVNVPISIIDYEIGTAEEFTAYLQDVIDNKLTENTIAKLTDNIDLGGKRLPTTSSFNIGSLQGVLDGQGHYVSNYKIYRYATFTGYMKNAVVKNIAFINVIKDTTNDGGLFSNCENKNVVMENVFIQGKITVNGARQWGVAQNFGGKETTLTNVIVAVEFTGQGTYPYSVFGYTGSFATATNAFGVSLTAQGYSNGKSGEIYGSLRHLTSSLDEATISAFNSVKAGEKSVWIYDEATKSLYFGDTKEVLSNNESKPEFEIVKDDFIVSGDEFVVLQESAYNLTATLPGVEFELKEAVEGISIVSNVLAISKEVALGTAFTVKATAYGNIANTPATKEINLMVGEVLQTERYIKNKETTTKTNVARFGATNDNTAITLNGEAVTDFNIENGILKINLSALPTSLVNVDGEMFAEPLSVQIVVNGNKVIIAKYEVMDMLIETAQDFKAWVDTIKTENKSAATNSYWVELAKDINLKDITFTHTVHNASKNGTGFVQGLFNGNGYTVSNLNVVNSGQSGLFQKFGVFTLENVAFVNAVANIDNDAGFGYMFAYSQANTSSRFTIKNSYIKFTSEAETAKGVGRNGSIVQAGNYLTVKDSVLDITTKNINAFAITGRVTLENAIVVSPNKVLVANSVNVDSSNWISCGTFAKVATAACENLINIDHFDDLSYWTTEKNYPEWVGVRE